MYQCHDQWNRIKKSVCHLESGVSIKRTPLHLMSPSECRLQHLSPSNVNCLHKIGSWISGCTLWDVGRAQLNPVKQSPPQEDPPRSKPVSITYHTPHTPPNNNTEHRKWKINCPGLHRSSNTRRWRWPGTPARWQSSFISDSQYLHSLSLQADSMGGAESPCWE